MKIEMTSRTGCSVQLDTTMMQNLKQIAYANKTSMDKVLESLISSAINPANDRRSNVRVQTSGGQSTR